jgi:hypothetical protein
MKRLAVAMTVLAGVLTLPGVSAAKPLSFHDWSVRWSAKTTRDNAAVVKRCQKLFGASDLKFGMCYVKAGRANLRAERVVWEKQVAQVMRGQTADCRGAIRTYAMAARVRQTANLVYLDAHRRIALTRIAGDISGEPYATLKTVTDDAKARAIAICG